MHARMEVDIMYSGGKGGSGHGEEPAWVIVWTEGGVG